MVVIFSGASAYLLQTSSYMINGVRIRQSYIRTHVSLQQSAIGPQTTIVILIEFPDAIHNFSRDYMKKLVFTDMNIYYQEVSYNLTWIAGDTTSHWYSLLDNFTSYNVTFWDSPRDEYERLIEAAISATDNEVNFRKYEHILIVCAKNSTAKVHAREVPGLNVITNDGFTIYRAMVVSEYDTLGTLAHEFGHSIGLPDLYSYELANASKRSDVYMGQWDIMSSGNLVHMSAYCKIKLGWIPSQRIADVFIGQIVTLVVDPIENITQGIHVVRIPITNEAYYMVEVRQKVGYDTVLPDHGVLVTFVNETIAKMEQGKGPVRVYDADPSTGTLDDATFDIRYGKNPVFIDNTRNLAIVVLNEENQSFAIQATTIENGVMAADAATSINEARTRINKARTLIFISEKAKMLLRNAENETNLALQAFSQTDFESAQQHAWKSLIFVNAAYSAEQAFRQLLTIIGGVAMIVIIVIIVAIWRKRKRKGIGINSRI